MPSSNNQLIDNLFRTEYGRLVSILTRIYGISNIHIAEDKVQEALIAALDVWSIEGIPDNPAAWLLQVARRKVLNEFKHRQVKAAHNKILTETQNFESIDEVFLEHEIEDSQLRMIFTCCHPSISGESQIVLILKTLCGFGIDEVSRAMLTSKANINKKLYRAKSTIRQSKIPFSIPVGEELNTRLDTVCTALYLLFNEGYNPSSVEKVVLKEFCLEAIRLTKMLVDRFDKNPNLHALLGLMYLHISRFDARIDDHGGIVLFVDQDRTLWNKEMVALGIECLKRSMNDKILSSYHIEACIAAEHCMSKSFEATNWQNIHANYQMLEKLKPNPIIPLNLAIIESQLYGFERSISSLKKIEDSGTLATYHLLPATQGVFHLELGNLDLAKRYLAKSLSMKLPPKERDHLSKKLEECSNK